MDMRLAILPMSVLLVGFQCDQVQVTVMHTTLSHSSQWIPAISSFQALQENGLNTRRVIQMRVH